MLAESAPIEPYDKVERKAITVEQSASSDSPRIFPETLSPTEAISPQTTFTAQESEKGTIIIVPIASSETRVFPTTLNITSLAPSTLHQSGKGTVIIPPSTPTDSSRVYPIPMGAETLSGLEPVSTNSINPPTEPAYVPGPSGRGTIGLLTTCLLTLFICVWTAIHLNVFPQNASWLRRLVHKLGWALLALFAPEVVVWRAISQWESARGLANRHNEIMKEAKNELEIPIHKGLREESPVLPEGFVRAGLSLWERELSSKSRRRNKTNSPPLESPGIPKINITDVLPIVNEPKRYPKATANATMATVRSHDGVAGSSVNKSSALTRGMSRFRLVWKKIVSKIVSGIRRLRGHTSPLDNGPFHCKLLSEKPQDYLSHCLNSTPSLMWPAPL